MRMNNGFTLAEMVAVIAILMLLAVLSTPFVKGYIDDAYNGKAQIFMREFNEARLNFEKDYPGTTISDSGTTVSKCAVDDIYNTLTLHPSILFTCRYLKFPTDLEGRYNFQIGSTVSCNACSEAGVTPIVSMRGENGAGIYKDKCACMDNLGKVYKEEA